MKELEKIHNIIKKRLGDRHYESILVIDGTTGQNGLSQGLAPFDRGGVNAGNHFRV